MRAQAQAGGDPAWARARRVLCVRPGGLGAVLLCTPAMRVLRDALPGRSLTLLGSAAGAAALPFIPELEAAIVPATAEDALAQALAARRFDAAVLFTEHAKDALPAAALCRRAGIPLRLGYSRAHPRRLLTHWVAEREPHALVRHEVARQLALVRHAGAAAAADGGARDGGAPPLSFALREADLATMRARLLRLGIGPGQPWLLLHPGAGAAARRYPASLWIRALALLARRGGLPALVVGGHRDAGLVETIRAGCVAALGAGSGAAVHALAGCLSLGELGAALRLASVALANNSGPAQVAAAVGTPVVVPYALTHPQQTPWKVSSRVLFQDVGCRFCYQGTCAAGHHACLAGVAPERVAAAALELLAAPAGGRATCRANA